MAEANSTVSYRDIPGFPGYRVGDDGSVWSRWKGSRSLSDEWRPMKLSPGSKGYLRVNLSRPEGSYKTFRIHRLVLECFVGPCPEGMEARHFPDHDKSNNRLENLSWGTAKANAADRRTHDHFGPNARYYTHDGQTMLLKDWARKAGIPYLCLWHRIGTLGMTFEEAITRPYKGTSSNGGHWTKAKRAAKPE